MKGKAFIDTNPLIYFVSNDLAKKQRVNELLIRNPSIAVSTQVINEFVAVSIKKNINSREDTFRFATEFMELFELVTEDMQDGQVIEEKLTIINPFKGIC